MEFDFTIEGEERPRRAFRARVGGLDARVHTHDRAYPVKDISATGLALLDETQSFRQGESLVLDLEIHHRPFLRDMPVKVIRVLDEGVVGLDFAGLDRRMEQRLDKLVLEVQKRLIDLRKARELAAKQAAENGGGQPGDQDGSLPPKDGNI